MIKKLMVFVLVVSMASPVFAASSHTALMLDKDAAKAVEAEIETYLKQEAKSNKKIALAMQTEAAKRQLIAYFVTGIVVAGGIAFVVYYFKNKADRAAQAEKDKADKLAAENKAVAATTGAAQATASGVVAADKPSAKTDDCALVSADALQDLRKEILGDVVKAFRTGANYLEKQAGKPDESLAVVRAELNELKAQIRIMREPVVAPVAVAAPAVDLTGMAAPMPAPVVTDFLAMDAK